MTKKELKACMDLMMAIGQLKERTEAKDKRIAELEEIIVADCNRATECFKQVAELEGRLVQRTEDLTTAGLRISAMKNDIEDAALMLLKAEIITISRAAELMQCRVVDVRAILQKRKDQP